MFMEMEIQCSCEKQARESLNFLYTLGAKLSFSKKGFMQRVLYGYHIKPYIDIKIICFKNIYSFGR